MGWWQWIDGAAISGEPMRAATMRGFGWGWQALIFYLAIATTECRQIPWWSLRYGLAPLVFLLLRAPGKALTPDRTWIPSTLVVLLVSPAFAEGPRFVSVPRREPSKLDVLPYAAAVLMTAVCLRAHLGVLGDPALAWDGQRWAVFAVAVAGDGDCYLRYVGADGAVGPEATRVTLDGCELPAAAWDGTAFVLAYRREDTVVASRIGPDGQPLGDDLPLGLTWGITELRLAGHAGHYALGYRVDRYCGPGCRHLEGGLALGPFGCPAP